MVTNQNESVVLGFRNMVIGMVLLALLFFSCLYISGVALLVSVRGASYYKEIFVLPFIEQISIMINMFKEFWNYWFQNKASLSFSSNDSFTAKLFISSFLPISTYLILFYIFRDKIMEFKPFKEQESVHGTAHWATPREVRKAGLSAKKGLLMGKYRGK